MAKPKLARVVGWLCVGILVLLGVSWAMLRHRDEQLKREALRAAQEQLRLVERLRAEERERDEELARLSRQLSSGPKVRHEPVRLPTLEPEWGARAYACKKASDCALTPYSDGVCCPGVCKAGQAVAKGFAEALRAQRVETQCEKRDTCPQAICNPPCERVSAVCAQGRCSEARTPLPCEHGRRTDLPKPEPCSPSDPLCSDL